MLLEALGEGRDFRFAEIPSRLERILFDLVHGELQETAVFGGGFLERWTWRRRRETAKRASIE